MENLKWIYDSKVFIFLESKGRRKHLDVDDDAESKSRRRRKRGWRFSEYVLNCFVLTSNDSRVTVYP